MLQNVKQFFDRHILPGGAEAGQGADHALQPFAKLLCQYHDDVKSFDN